MHPRVSGREEGAVLGPGAWLAGSTRREIFEGMIGAMVAIHISEAEAARDFAGLLARVRAGAEVVIDKGAYPAVVLRVANEPAVRRLSESLRMAREHRSAAVLDEEFVHDLKTVISSHPESLQSSWD